MTRAAAHAELLATHGAGPRASSLSSPWFGHLGAAQKGVLPKGHGAQKRPTGDPSKDPWKVQVPNSSAGEYTVLKVSFTWDAHCRKPPK